MKGVRIYIVAILAFMSLNFNTVHAQTIGERGCDSVKAYTYSDIAYESSSIDTTLKYGILSLQYCCECDTEIISRNYHNIGWAYHNLARDKEALPYMHSAVKYAKMMNDSAGLCGSYNLLAEVYNYLDFVDSTFYYLNMSLDIAMRIKDTMLLSDCYNMMGTASHNGDFKQAAQDYYYQAAHLDSISGNFMGLAFNLKLLGSLCIDYYNESKSDSLLSKARYYLRESIRLYEQEPSDDPNDITRLYITYGEMANAYILTAKYTGVKAFADSCLIYYQKASVFFGEHGYSDEHFKILGIYTDYLLFCHRYADAAKFLTDVEARLKPGTPKTLLKSFHAKLKSVYEHLGDWHNAYLQLSKEYEYSMAVTNDSSVTAITNSKAQQAVMIERLNHETAKKLFDNERNKMITLVVFLVVVLVIVAGFVWYIVRLLMIRKKVNKELSEKNELLDIQTTELMIHKEIMMEQWHDVEDVNNKLFSSIRYAQKIQRAAVSSQKDIQALFPNSFIFYRPRDIVSGDFYMAVKCGRYSVMITADCTGHGIPGAFLSMLGISALKEFMVTESDAENPGSVLDRMREFIKSTLISESDLRIDDGIDMTICCFDFQQMVLRYAIANQTALIVRNGNTIRLKGDAMPVGHYIHESDHFSSFSTEIQHGDMIYMFSDGIQDQLGGTKQTDNGLQKKFLIRNLLITLKDLSKKPISDQGTLLERTVDLWRGDTPQVDDMTLVGIRV